MKKDSISLEIGDSVKVREGMMCPDMEDLCIEGWRGRVSEVGEDKDGNALICIRWDSLTLKNGSLVSRVAVTKTPETFDIFEIKFRKTTEDTE